VAVVALEIAPTTTLASPAPLAAQAALGELRLLAVAAAVTEQARQAAHSKAQGQVWVYITQRT
jgi:hypothetical protein